MIIESVRDFFLTCDFLKDHKVSVDYLDVKMSYSIDPLPADPIVKKYADGSTVKQFLFAFTSNEAFDGDARTGIENSGFYQKLEEWIETKDRNYDYPLLDDPKQIPIGLKVIQSGYLYDAGSDLGQYQIQFALQYEQEV